MSANERPVLLFLHGLGCSARTWEHVIAELGDEFECLAVDLPGHGAAVGSDLLTVEQMVGWSLQQLLDRRPARWALVGHSMGGKIATIVTARAEKHVVGLSRPIGLVLVAASPLRPEPMDEATRAEMIGWCADGPVSDAGARRFIAANTAAELPPDRLAPAIADVQRVARTAWLAWLERGSREDWSDAVGPVRTPTLVVAGSADGALGADAQRRWTLPHVAADEVVQVAGAAHLIALEQAESLARLISGNLRTVLAGRGLAADGLGRTDRLRPGQRADPPCPARSAARTRRRPRRRWTVPRGRCSPRSWHASCRSEVPRSTWPLAWMPSSRRGRATAGASPSCPPISRPGAAGWPRLPRRPATSSS